MKDLLRVFLSSGGRLRKGKVLGPFSSVVIYMLLITSSLFENALCLCMFENILKIPVVRKLYNDSRECVQSVCLKIFLKVFVCKIVCFVCEQAINSCLPTQSLSCYFLLL